MNNKKQEQIKAAQAEHGQAILRDLDKVVEELSRKEDRVHIRYSLGSAMGAIERIIPAVAEKLGREQGVKPDEQDKIEQLYVQAEELIAAKVSEFLVKKAASYRAMVTKLEAGNA